MAIAISCSTSGVDDHGNALTETESPPIKTAATQDTSWRSVELYGSYRVQIPDEWQKIESHGREVLIRECEEIFCENVVVSVDDKGELPRTVVILEVLERFHTDIPDLTPGELQLMSADSTLLKFDYNFVHNDISLTGINYLKRMGDHNVMLTVTGLASILSQDSMIGYFDNLAETVIEMEK